MNYNEAQAATLKIICQWLGEQTYLRKFKVDYDLVPYAVSVTIIANNFWENVTFNLVPIATGDTTTDDILRELNETGAQIRKKIEHTMDPNRLPG